MPIRVRSTPAKKPKPKRERRSEASGSTAKVSTSEPKPKSARAPRAQAKRAKVPASPRQSPSVRALKKALAPTSGEAALGPDADRMRDFDWEDGQSATAEPTELYNRWSDRGDALTRRLAEFSVDERLYEVDLRAGRIQWVDDGGRVLCEARAQLLCCHLPAQRKLVMAWADPVLAALGAAAASEDAASEIEDLDDLGAWVASMRAAEACSAEFLYRVPGPVANHFLALRHLRAGEAARSAPGIVDASTSPVSLVLAQLDGARRVLDAERVSAEDVRDLLGRAGADVTRQSETTFRESEWTGRLTRTGRLLLQLSSRLARPTYTAIALGRPCDDLASPEIAEELRRAVGLLIDEWSAFA